MAAERVRIAVASGKGGTGKTMVALNMAAAAPERVTLLDCDVEEPNAHLFLEATGLASERVTLPTPDIDENRCTACGKCVAWCQFNALALLGDRILVYPELCHGCGACVAACGESAVTEARRPIGMVHAGPARFVDLVYGELAPRETQAPTVIRAVKARAGRAVSIIDAPPGTSCAMVEAVRDCDAALLVTEPTPFGLSDLQMAVEVLCELEIPFGVVINRDGLGDGAVEQWCGDRGIPVVARIPHDLRVARACAHGQLAVAEAPDLRPHFADAYAAARALARQPLEAAS
jgi:MinD superfamily P-loop ATPase